MNMPTSTLEVFTENVKTFFMRAGMDLIELPYTERYVRLCERSGVSHLFLFNWNQKGGV